MVIDEISPTDWRFCNTYETHIRFFMTFPMEGEGNGIQGMYFKGVQFFAIDDSGLK